MIPTIKEQIDLEKRMIAYGITRYRQGVASAEENGRAAETGYAQKLMQSFLEPVAISIVELCAKTEANKTGKARVLLRKCDPYKAAYFGVKTIINAFTASGTATEIALRIGTMIEDELKFSLFQTEHKEYYNTIIEDFKRKGTKSYRHMHRVLTVKANEHSVKWESWATADKALAGMAIIDCILRSTNLIRKGQGEVKHKGHRGSVLIEPTAECLDWVKNFKHYSEMLNPDRVPCIIPPDPWTDINQGGYYSPVLRSKTPLVKTRSEAQIKMLQEADMNTVMNAVNVLQETEWEINKEVLALVKQTWDAGIALGLPQSEPFIIPDCPIVGKAKKEFTNEDRERFEVWKSEARTVHSMERERVSKCFQVIRVLRLASEFAEYDKFWYVYQCDFRGRVYATVAGLSPQGADAAKALLKFHRGKAVGKQGALWFKIHGANCFGKDKLSYADRIKWVDDNERLLLEIANNPLSTSNHWAGADKPWQFIAWCLEYKQFKQDGEKFISRIPIALDGSCNGLQNFSAILRDRVGGATTNLLPNTQPNDIYSEVAKVLTTKLRLRPSTDDKAQCWLRLADKYGGILPRTLTKRPVMTLPYGSTQQSCKEYIYKFLIEYEPEFFDKKDRFWLSYYLTPILWASISDVVVAARKAMDWLQVSASKLAKKKHGTIWTAPNGFPVYHSRMKYTSHQIWTQLAGAVRLRLNEVTDKLDVQKQKQAIAPNFVHSMDASHLMLTVLAGQAEGITAFACIHDDFGCHACDTPKLHKCIRGSFVKMYTEHNPIAEFIKSNEHDGIILPQAPEIGSLDLNEVIKAAYFFG